MPQPENLHRTQNVEGPVPHRKLEVLSRNIKKDTCVNAAVIETSLVNREDTHATLTKCYCCNHGQLTESATDVKSGIAH